MSSHYRVVDWNPEKRRYDFGLGILVAVTLVAFGVVTAWKSPEVTVETLLIRGTALVAFLLLHLVLAIGPLARLDRRFLPLLYNRRHLGVTLFGIGLVHGGLSLFQFHALGDVNPFVSVLTSYSQDARLLSDGRLVAGHFPFEPFGVAGLAVLFLLAATSHDFWLKLLGPSLWKSLHLGAYLAYLLLFIHVAAGVVQAERSVIPPTLLSAGFLLLLGLHVAAARKGFVRRPAVGAAVAEGFVDVGEVEAFQEARGRVVTVGEGRIAVFRHRNRIFATSNVCRHQGGPLGEGRILDGCITCPWHGWNYRPEDGCSPPPFEETLETHATRIVGGRLWVRAEVNPLRTVCPGSESTKGRGE